jgi:hypothetical protein
MKTVKCLPCDKKLEYMGITFIEQSRGNVCVPCKDCLLPDVHRGRPPESLSKMYKATSPAVRLRLEQAGVL